MILKKRIKGDGEHILTCCNKPTQVKPTHISDSNTTQQYLSTTDIFSKNGACKKITKLLAILSSCLIGKPTKCESKLLNGNVILNVSIEVI